MCHVDDTINPPKIKISQQAKGFTHTPHKAFMFPDKQTPGIAAHHKTTPHRFAAHAMLPTQITTMPLPSTTPFLLFSSSFN